MTGRMPRHLVIESQLMSSPTLLEPKDGEYLSHWDVYEQGTLVRVSAEFRRRDAPQAPPRVSTEYWDLRLLNRVHVEGDIENPGEP